MKIPIRGNEQLKKSLTALSYCFKFWNICKATLTKSNKVGIKYKNIKYF
jgi:hypothetical protein